MQFELVTTDGSGKPARIVDEAEATRLLLGQYKHTDFLEGLKHGQCASVEGGVLRQCMTLMEQTMSSDQIDAARYRWWREHVDAIAEDEAGVHGLAFSCQVPVAVIEKATTAELMDMIADHHLPPNSNYPER